MTQPQVRSYSFCRSLSNKKAIVISTIDETVEKLEDLFTRLETAAAVRDAEITRLRKIEHAANAVLAELDTLLDAG